MVCLERSGSRTTCNRCKNRSIYFKISVILFKNSLDFMNNSGSLVECLSYFRIHDKVSISLSVSDICILQSMPFVRKNLQRFGKKYDIAYFDRYLAVLSLEHCSFNTNDVTDIISLEPAVLFVTDSIFSNVALDSSLFILNIDEGSLAHLSESHNSSCA